MIKWIDRTLMYGPRVALVTSARDFRRALRDAGIADDGAWIESHWHACTHAYDVDGVLVCIVAIDARKAATQDPIDVASLLAHEAVHVWQRVAETLGGDVGREMPAYAIQNICAHLMRAYRATFSSAALGRVSRAS